MPDTKYQTLINLCRTGNLSRAKNMVLQWIQSGEEFDNKYVMNIIMTYQSRFSK
jgi:hypothetical protein